MCVSRHVHRELLHSALLNLAPIIPATACHQINEGERYSRSMHEHILTMIGDDHNLLFLQE